jgi:xyloglucan:xyloglucosyl transferase
MPEEKKKNLVACLLLVAAMAVVLLHLHPPAAAAEAQQASSPGYYPSSTVSSMAFSEGYANLWGPQHQTLSQDHKAVTLLMDRTSGIHTILYGDHQLVNCYTVTNYK